MIFFFQNLNEFELSKYIYLNEFEYKYLNGNVVKACGWAITNVTTTVTFGEI